jgi:hypothetical protein
MTNLTAVTIDGKDISETSDIKVIYSKTLLSEDEYRKLQEKLGVFFLDFYLGLVSSKFIDTKEFAEDVAIYPLEKINEGISLSVLDSIGFLQEDDKTYSENQYTLYSSNLSTKYKLSYEKISNNPLEYLHEILSSLNTACKECKFKSSYFEIEEYTKNGVKVKLQKLGFRRMFNIDYMCCDNEQLIFNISLTVNNLENKVKYWLRFHDSDKYYHVIFNYQASQSRDQFIDQYPYLIFILDLINQ